jgi:signal transduction histidine kinase/ActR/RegA family two-component response regulator
VTILYAASTWWNIRVDRRTTTAAAERQAQGNVRALAEHAARAFGEADRLLDSVSHEVDELGTGPGARRAIQAFMSAELRRMPQLRSILLVDADGEVFVNSSEFPMVKRFNVAERDYFLFHRDHPGDGLFVGRPVKSRFNGKWLISIARRIAGPGGQFRGVVVAAVEPEYFNSFYRSFEVGPGGSVFLFREDAVGLVRQPFSETLMNFDFRKFELFRKHLPAADEGLFHVKSVTDGRRKLIAYRRVAGFPLVTQINLVEDDYLAAWRARTGKEVAGGVVMVLLASALCWTLLRQIRGLERSGEALSAQVAERERAEIALRESEERLVQSQKMEAVGRLAGGVAHDFNNLLVVIAGYAELLLERTGPGAPGSRELSEILAAANRAADLTRQLLAFSRRQMLQPRVLDLNGVIAGLEDMIRRLIGEDVELCVSLSGEPMNVKADPAQIEQAVVNLAVNARDAMPEGGRLSISTREVTLERTSLPAVHGSLAPGAHVLLEVADTGIGMTDAVRAHAFEPFFTTKEKGKGTGLGLSTVYGIVNQSNGHIVLDSTPGRGSTFRIFLPMEPAGAEAPPKPPAATPPAHPGGTVLVVEDAEAVRSLVCRILAECGYEVLEAPTGADALALVDRFAGAIDLLVTDVIMPGMSGPELARRMTGRNPGTRVLFMSGYTDDLLARHGVQEPGIDYIQKPFTPDALARKVFEALARVGA